MMTLIMLLLLIPTFAIFDRWCGGGLGWKSSFRGRPLYYVIALIPLFFLVSWQLGVVLAGWCLWRLPTWKMYGGSLAPNNWTETLGTFYRHSVIALPVGFVTWGGGSTNNLLATWGILLIWAAVATRYAVWNRQEADKGIDVNGYVELARGATFGAMAAVILHMVM
jgi:hypothetical protein